MTKQRVLTEAQIASFYKFEKGCNLKECNKLDGPQFAVFDSELETQSNRKANVIPSIKWREIEQVKSRLQLSKDVNDHLLSYEPGA